MRSWPYASRMGIPHAQKSCGRIYTGSCTSLPAAYIQDTGNAVRQQKKPLNTCTSLDMELTGEGDGELLLGNTIEDPQSEQPFEAVEDAMMYEELRRAVDSLPDREQKIIQYHLSL